MRLKIAIILLLFIVFALQQADAQGCSDFHIRNCPIPDLSYFYDHQSASSNLKIGESMEVRIVAFEKSDYFVSICWHRRFQTAQLKIFEDTPERNLLFDNANYNYADSVKFNNDITRKLIFELSIPEDQNDESDTRSRCVGIMIANRIKVDDF